jgi:hypothetical protein
LVFITKICYPLARSTLPSINSLERWFGEPVRAAILQTNVMIPFINVMNSYCRIDMYLVAGDENIVLYVFNNMVFCLRLF